MTGFQPPEPPPGETVLLATAQPMPLAQGGALGPVRIAYRSWGRLNRERSNAILIAHALSGDQYVTGINPVTGRAGWWDRMVGPGKPIDTDRYFVLASNVLGGCMGSTGPASIDVRTGRAYGPDFPAISISDMVAAQALLLDSLGIDTLFLVVGGSMGGMQALQWLKDHPGRVFASAAFAAGARHSPQQIALHMIGRQAIAADADWQDGRYHGSGRAPLRGLAVARMLAHLSYRAPGELEARFGRRPSALPVEPTDPAALRYEVERYIAHQGNRFPARFDAASYMTITRAMDDFELAPRDRLAEAFADADARVFLAAFDSDWLYPPAETEELAIAMRKAGLDVDFAVHRAIAGHDSFLLETPGLDEAFMRFLDRAAEARGLLP